jgi:hypothetical protein
MLSALLNPLPAHAVGDQRPLDPEPYGLAVVLPVLRVCWMVEDLFLPVSDPGDGVSPDAITLGIWVFTPMLMVLLASWLVGRFVAGSYVGGDRLTRPPSHGA